MISNSGVISILAAHLLVGGVVEAFEWLGAACREACRPQPCRQTSATQAGISHAGLSQLVGLGARNIKNQSNCIILCAALINYANFMRLVKLDSAYISE
jgi:hypothetical protein